MGRKVSLRALFQRRNPDEVCYEWRARLICLLRRCLKCSLTTCQSLDAPNPRSNVVHDDLSDPGLGLKILVEGIDPAVE